MQIFCRYVDRQLTYLQISATFMQIFCRYCCSYAAVLQQICDRYLQTFYIYVSLVRVEQIVAVSIGNIIKSSFETFNDTREGVIIGCFKGVFRLFSMSQVDFFVNKLLLLVGQITTSNKDNFTGLTFFSFFKINI